MALSSDSLSVVAAALGFLLILACTLPAIRKLVYRLAKKHQPIWLATEPGMTPFAHQDNFQAQYEDEDGVATKASLRAFSDGWQKATIMVLSIVGFHLALALAVVARWSAPDVRNVPLWLQAAAWVGVARRDMRLGPRVTNLGILGAFLSAICDILYGATLCAEV